MRGRSLLTHSHLRSPRPGLRPTTFVLQTIKILDQEVDKRPDLGRHVLAVLVSDIDLQSRQVPIVENRYEAARHKFVVDDVDGLDHDAETVQASLADNLSFIRFQHTVDLDGMCRLAFCKGKLVGIIRERIDQKAVTFEIL